MSLLDDLLPAPAIARVEAPSAVWPAGLPDHLSASSIAMYQRCREQWRRRYVLGERERPGAALVWGSADHFAHEQNFTQKIASGEDLPADDVKVAFAEGFDQAVARNGGESEVVWDDDKPGALKDAGTLLVAVYHETVSPLVQPTAVEEKFTVELPGVPVPVVGRMDVLTAAAAIERKTARQKPQNGEPKPDWRIQGLLYQYVRQQQVDWHVSVKTKTPAVYTPKNAPGLALPVAGPMVAATAELVRTTARDMLAIFQEFGPDEPWPGAVTHPWACGFCGFRPSCRWWGAT
jgi:hypothetical protein